MRSFRAGISTPGRGWPPRRRRTGRALPRARTSPSPTPCPPPTRSSPSPFSAFGSLGRCRAPLRRRPADLDDVKGLLELLCSLLGLPAPRYAALTSEPTLHPGRAARVGARDTAGALAISGVVGEGHPAAAAAWDER